MSQLWAGTGRSDITPAPGTPQGGWGAQTHQRGIGADLPFYATALVLSDGADQTAIVDVDAIGFDGEWTTRILDAIEELSRIPRQRIRFSCSHTHSGPNTFRLATISEGLDMVLSYLDGLPRRIAAAVWQAQQNLRPVRCAAGTGSCDNNVNRRFRTPEGAFVVGRNWEGAVDRTVRVVRFDDLEEQPVATILHYACHPTTIAWQNQWFTPDYPGAARRVVEQQLGGMCLFLQGATGNLTPRRGFTGDLRVYRRLGAILGLEAAKVALTLETLPRRECYRGVLQSGAALALYDDLPEEPAVPVLRVASRKIALPLKQFRPAAEVEAEAEALRAELMRLRREGSEEEVRAATARATQAGWQATLVRTYAGRTTVDLELQCIRIGSIALISCQGEPFIETALQVVAGSPFPHTLFSGYSNGGFGYIPTRQAYAEGGYETVSAAYAPGAAEMLADESIRLLREMANHA